MIREKKPHFIAKKIVVLINDRYSGYFVCNLFFCCFCFVFIAVVAFSRKKRSKRKRKRRRRERE